jgi:hypothetical protein
LRVSAASGAVAPIRELPQHHPNLSNCEQVISSLMNECSNVRPVAEVHTDKETFDAVVEKHS